MDTTRGTMRIFGLFVTTLLITMLLAVALPTQAQGLSPAHSNSPGSQSQLNAADPLGILNIPLLPNAVVKVDGICDTSAGGEYSSAVQVTFIDGNGKNAVVYLQANADNLYICMVAQGGGAYPVRFGTVYLDPQGDGSTTVYADQSDWAFRQDITSKNRTSYVGNSSPNGWTLNPGLDSFWSAATGIDGVNGTETVEWAIQRTLNFGQNCSIFGLSDFHHWYNGVGDDYHFPKPAIFDQPRTWQLAQIGNGNCTGGRIAYVFRGATADAVSFFNLLATNGYAVTLVPLANVLGTNFASFDLTIIADDSGNLDQWGSSGLTTSQRDQILAAKKPIIGVGEGGYAFFGTIPQFIGWPMGWHGPQRWMWKNLPASPPFSGIAGNPVQHYLVDHNSVGIYLNPNQTLPSDVTVYGLESPLDDHASLIQQGCHLLWGNGGDPQLMSTDGQTLFINSLAMMTKTQCPVPTTPPQGCLKLVKTDDVSGASVTPGQVITYTLTYTFSNDPACGLPQEGKLVDVVPSGTTFIPGSATGGIAPAGDGSLVWQTVPAAGDQIRTFKVVVDESACVAGANLTVSNTATLSASGFPPLSSSTTHPVTCPPVTLPNSEPSYAEDELQVWPYPLTAGRPSEVSVRVHNNSTAPVTLAVAFQVAPAGLGIGLAYTTFDTRSVTIPVSGAVLLKSNYTPPTSGQACFQVSITGGGLSQPLITQSCLDMTEDFSSGGALDFTFPVRNSTASPASIMLVVDNTCPGWSAAITAPPGGVTSVLGAGGIVNATLHVTPPSGGMLGSGCHIDVQGWVNTPSGPVMIGGVRKVDIPPVHLPPHVTPPWEEQEISFIPNPPVAGHSGQVCVTLANPLAVAKTVTIDFSEADFGAGIAFTPIGSLVNVSIPANSLAAYCINWTPAGTGTLHRCILVTLHQAGYRDEVSQRNLDLVRTLPGSLGAISVPIKLTNPDLVAHTLTFDLEAVGLDPYWKPVITDGLGGPPPAALLSGETIGLSLHLVPAVGTAQLLAGPPTEYRYGDSTKVQVGVLLDGVLVNGFTVELSTSRVFIPVARK